MTVLAQKAWKSLTLCLLFRTAVRAQLWEICQKVEGLPRGLWWGLQIQELESPLCPPPLKQGGLKSWSYCNCTVSPHSVKANEAIGIRTLRPEINHRINWEGTFVSSEYWDVWHWQWWWRNSPIVVILPPSLVRPDLLKTATQLYSLSSRECTLYLCFPRHTGL